MRSGYRHTLTIWVPDISITGTTINSLVCLTVKSSHSPRNLSAHVESHPHRNLDALRKAAEMVILLPLGYNLGHVEMGRGNLWGVGELNLERRNREGVKYRTVMHNFFTEIERAIRLGIAFDLLWDLDQHLTVTRLSRSRPHSGRWQG